VPLTSEQLQGLIQQHISSKCNDAAVDTFVKVKQNTLELFISHVLERNQWSVQKILILQSVPVDWRMMAEGTVLG
jgi:hypothetical protein